MFFYLNNYDLLLNGKSIFYINLLKQVIQENKIKYKFSILNSIDITEKPILTSEEISNQTNTEQNSEDHQLESYVSLILNSSYNKITWTFDNGSLSASLTTKNSYKFQRRRLLWNVQTVQLVSSMK